MSLSTWPLPGAQEGMSEGPGACTEAEAQGRYLPSGPFLTLARSQAAGPGVGEEAHRGHPAFLLAEL